ncbi:MAG: hypothetical protein K2I37_00190 [Muribaculaceae bacterium]|nr:hypothetical protein [Muribaculaceae bacterium]
MKLMKLILSKVLFIALGTICYSCTANTASSNYINEDEAAVELVKKEQPQVRDNRISVAGKYDRHDGANHHIGYDILLYDSNTNLYLPVVISAFPNVSGCELSFNLHTSPYPATNYGCDVSPSSLWVSRSEIIVKPNPFNGDNEFHYIR